MTRLLVITTLVSWGLLAFGCSKQTARGPRHPTHEASTTASTATPMLPDAFITGLAERDREAVLALATDELVRDLEQRRFEELADTFALLGSPNTTYLKSATPIEGGERRHYVLDYDVGLVELELSVQGERILGFRFAGGGFERALNEAHAHNYEEFRVYDFDYVSGAHSDEADEAVLDSPRVQWSMVVGGLEKMGGRYDVTIEQRCSRGGKAVFREPLSFDLRFADEGGPTGTIGGHVEVPGPGTYDLDIVVHDNIGIATLHHQVKFRVEASTGPESARRKSRGRRP